jgi:hypothetical protein
MDRTRTGYALKRFPIEEHSITGLLDSPIAGLPMIDNVDCRALERLLLDQIAHSVRFGKGLRVPARGSAQMR